MYPAVSPHPSKSGTTSNNQAVLRLKAEQFANLVVLIGETISLFFSQLNLVGIFTHHFFMLKIAVEPNAGSSSGIIHQTAIKVSVVF